MAAAQQGAQFGDIMGSLAGSPVALSDFDPLHRLVLTSNGNLQRVVSALHDALVRVRLEYNREAGEGRFERQVSAGGVLARGRGDAVELALMRTLPRKEAVAQAKAKESGGGETEPEPEPVIRDPREGTERRDADRRATGAAARVAGSTSAVFWASKAASTVPCAAGEGPSTGGFVFRTE